VPTRINGLPAHVLLVHAVVVVIPAAALLLIAAAWWPAARRRLGLVTPAVALVALVLVPVTTNAGEWLQERVPATPLINRHAELGDSLLPWVLAMFVVAVFLWYVQAGARLSGRWGSGARRLQTGRHEPAASVASGTTTNQIAARPHVVTLVAAALATVLAVGSVVEVVRIGESGSKAVWQGNVSSQVHQVPGGG
jgi:hypothetical protein